MTVPLSSIAAPALALGTEYYLFGAAGLLTVCVFVGLILVPALGSYGRVWEKLAASFLTLFILATMLGVGVAIGLAVVWSYDQYA